MPGHEAWWGWEELADLWGAGQAGLELQIILEIASCSVCNQDQTGSGWGRRKSLSIFVKLVFACVCLPAERDDIREGDGGNVPPPHPLLNNSSACLGSLQVCGCSTAHLLMEPAITNVDILTFK